MIRVSITKNGDSTEVAYTNPKYTAAAYRMAGDGADIRGAVSWPTSRALATTIRAVPAALAIGAAMQATDRKTKSGFRPMFALLGRFCRRELPGAFQYLRSGPIHSHGVISYNFV